jgi:hypothetical protein
MRKDQTPFGIYNRPHPNGRKGLAPGSRNAGCPGLAGPEAPAGADPGDRPRGRGQALARQGEALDLVEEAVLGLPEE